MRAVLLAALTLAGILLCARVFVGDLRYREARDRPLDDPERVRILEQANRIDSGDPIYAFRLGESALETGRLGDALEWFEEAARRNPLMARAQFWWGVAEDRLGHAEKALERMEVARRLAPFNLDLNRRIAEHYASRWGRTRSREDLRRAFETAHAIRRVEPDAVSERLVEVLMGLPLLRYEDLVDALDEVAPGDAEARLTLARTLAGANRLRWALRAFDEADRIADASGTISLDGRLLAFKALRRDHPDAALARIREGLVLVGEHRFPYELELALVLLETAETAKGDEKKTRDDEACLALRRHLRKGAERDLPETIVELREVFVRARSRARGPRVATLASIELAFWEQARTGYSSLDGIEMDYLASIAALLAGRKETALGAIQRFLTRHADDPRALYQAALCYEALDRRKLAREHVKLALRFARKPEYLALDARLDPEEDR